MSQAPKIPGQAKALSLAHGVPGGCVFLSLEGAVLADSFTVRGHSGSSLM